MIPLHNLNYVVLGVSNAPAWLRLTVDCLGMMAGDAVRNGDVVLRLDEQAQRLILEPGEDDDLRVAGWELTSLEALRSFEQHLNARGVQTHQGDGELRRRRRVAHLIWCDDPNGFRHEFCVGPEKAATPFRSSCLSGGFVTGPLGLGHILPKAVDFPASCDWYANALGLGHTDDIIEVMPEGHTVHARFFHAAGGRHHSLATALVPSPKKLTHFMVEVANPDEVEGAQQRCLDAGFSLVRQLGHHPNDDMTSFYVATPSGVSLEFGSGGRVLDPKQWTPSVYDQLSDWGHQRLTPPN